MDLVRDAFFDGHRFRLLTVVDNFSRECLAVVMWPSLRGEDVVEQAFTFADESWVCSGTGGSWNMI